MSSQWSAGRRFEGRVALVTGAGWLARDLNSLGDGGAAHEH